jgi:sulfide dehydrogenase cytochrome subunit
MPGISVYAEVDMQRQKQDTRRLHQIRDWLGLVLLMGCGSVVATPSALPTCVGCHGTHGGSQDPDIPIIASMSQTYLQDQLVIFQEAARPCLAAWFAQQPQDVGYDHCVILQDHDADTLSALAEHYARQAFQPLAQTIDAAEIVTGAALHERSCRRCHTQEGMNPADDSGILGGQGTNYLLRSMRFFRDGEREQPPRKQQEMQGLSEADMQALAAFYASRRLP